jgi:hypothetical protein
MMRDEEEDRPPPGHGVDLNAGTVVLNRPDRDSTK